MNTPKKSALNIPLRLVGRRLIGPLLRRSPALRRVAMLPKGWLAKLKNNKTWRRSTTKQRFTATAIGFMILALLVNVLLPVAEARAQQTLNWSDTADFSYNKASKCGQTGVDKLVISGASYTDSTCAAAGQSSDLTLGSAESSILDVQKISAGSIHSLAVKTDGTVWAWGSNSNGQLGNNTTNNSPFPAQVKDAAGTGFLTGVSAIAAGSNHSLALKTDGTVWAWGINSNSQLGDNTTTQRLLPVQVKDPAGTGFLTGVSAIATGSNHSLALKPDGTVWAWGYNFSGQLGDNTTTNRSLPVQTKDPAGTGFLTGVSAIATGSNHSLAVKTDGTVWALGSNSNGQLGDNTTTQRLLPVQVKDPAGTGFLTGVSAISAGGTFSAALKTDGTVWAWGYNSNGQLGDNTTTQRLLPVQVKDPAGTGFLTGVSAIATGSSYSLALKTDGTAWAWGYNSSGQLGDNTTTQRNLPVQVKDPAGTGFLTGVSAIATGSNHSLALKTDSSVWGWGLNSSGQAGRKFYGGSASTPNVIVTTATVAPLSGVAAVSAGTTHSLALKADGTVWAWGSGSLLGDNTSIARPLPVQVKDPAGTGFLTGVSAIAAGSNHSLAIKTDGTVWAWGVGSSGQLGDNTTTTRLLPVQVKDPAGTGFLTGVSAIAASGSYSLALKTDGTVWGWGWNGNNQLGDNTTTQRNLPVQVKDPAGTGFLTGVSAIAAGGSHSLAAKTDGTAWAWGLNSTNQLGDNTTTQRNLPVQVKDPAGTGFLTGVTKLAAGASHSLAVKTDGTAWAWGSGNSGQLGDSTASQRALPVQVKGAGGTGFLTDVSTITAGTSYSSALKTDGTVWGWGLNSGGQFGDNTTTVRTSPAQTKDPAGTGFLTGVSALAGGNAYSLAAKADGTAWAWGLNTSTQLASGDLVTPYLKPTAVLQTVEYETGYSTTGSLSGLVVDRGAGKKTQWYGINWVSDALPANTSIIFNARTSNDNTTWSDWNTSSVQTTVGSTSGTADLNSLPFSRYLEVKVSMTSDHTATPKLNDFSVNFMDDTTPPPTNASAVTMNKTQGGTALDDSSWMNTQTPYLSWTAGADEVNGSGVQDYCLYLGQDNTADVAQTKGLLGASPLNTDGVCQYAVSANQLDLSVAGVLATPLTTSDQPYYLLVKALDQAGNLYAGAAASYALRYDDAPPTNPSFISAPSQFVSSKDVTLTWPIASAQAASDNNSGIAGLQYKIGADGTWYGDAHNGQQDATDLLANDGSYRTNATIDYPLLTEGNNIVYFRTIDTAGNVSTSYITAVIKLNTSSPTPPQNITATPTTNTTNAFAFSWHEPASFVGPASGLTYCYTVNTLPTANTCSFTNNGQTSLQPDAYATQPGDNIFYVVAKDEAGNINYDTYSSVMFRANTPAPGVPINLELADISTKSAQIWKLAFSWAAPVDTGSGISKYAIYRSTNGVTFGQIATTSGLSYVDGSLDQVMYYYKVKACDSANNCGAFSEEFSKTPTGRFTSPPELSSNVSVEVSTRKATLKWLTDRRSDSRIQYGVATGVYFAGEIAVSELVKSHSVELLNLEAGTTYFYKVKWTDEDGNTGISSELSFTTLPAPVVKNVEIIKKTLNSATVQFTSTDASKVSLFYGKTDGFGGVVSINTSRSESTYSLELVGLDDGAIYSYKINTFDVDGNEYDSRRVDTFATPSRPRITNLRFQPVAGEPTSTQMVTWLTNVPTSSTVTYGKVNTNGGDVYVSKLTTEHEIVLRGLEDDSQYFLLAQSRDADGNLATSDRQVFKTALDTRPPKISTTRIETSVKGNGSEARGQIVMSWKTDEPATSQVAYADGSGGTDYANKTSEDTRLSTDHVVIISDLAVSKVYHLQPISRDRSQNTTKGNDKSAIIGRANESVLNIILNSLHGIFGI